MGKCPADLDGCRNTIGRGWMGWLAFAFLMVAHLLKDVIQGSKLIMLSGKTPQFWGKKKWGAFFGGMVLMITSLFVLYASTIYNNAIATTNTDLIANAVIILFVADLDEMMLSILVVIYPNLFPKDGSSEVIKEKVETLESDMQEGRSENLEMKKRFERSEADHLETKEKVKTLESELKETKELVERVESQMNEVFRKA